MRIEGTPTDRNFSVSRPFSLQPDVRHVHLFAGSGDMTTVITDLARQYRARAEEARARASAAITEEGRQSLLQIAETWERMAKWEGRIHPRNNQLERAGSGGADAT